MTKRFAVIILIFLAAQFGYAQKSKNYFSHLPPRHRQVLKKWLANQTGLRPATEKDASQENLKLARRDDGKFQPFYAAGDFNQDGKEDFAVLLKVKDANDSAVAVFNAPFNLSKPAYFEQGFGEIRTLYIEFNKDVKMLYLTEYESHGSYLQPKGKTYVRKDPLEDSQ